MHTTYGSIGVVSKGFPSGLADIFFVFRIQLFLLDGNALPGTFFLLFPCFLFYVEGG